MVLGPDKIRKKLLILLNFDLLCDIYVTLIFHRCQHYVTCHNCFCYVKNTMTSSIEARLPLFFQKLLSVKFYLGVINNLQLGIAWLNIALPMHTTCENKTIND